MPLFSLPQEILNAVFLQSVYVRSLPRAMRLMLVSSKRLRTSDQEIILTILHLESFKNHVTQAIFRSRILDKDFMDAIPRSNFLQGDDQLILRTRSILQKYMAYRIFFHDDKTYAYQIRYVAEWICEIKCETSEVELYTCIQELCGLHFVKEFPNRIHQCQTPQTNRERDVRQETLPVDLILAAVYLRLPTLAIQLHSESWEERYSLPRFRALTSVREARYGIAAFNGDLELLKGLLAHEPKDTADDKELNIRVESYALEMIVSSTYGCQAKVFDYAWELLPKDIEVTTRGSPYSHSLSKAMSETAFPEHYKQLAALFGLRHEIFSYRCRGDLNSRLCGSVVSGKVEMVRYFLDQGGLLNDPIASRRYTSPSVYNELCDRGLGVSEPLLLAAHEGGPRGNEAVVALLLDRGADPNWYPPEKTPLMAAVAKNRFSIVRILVEHGADVNDGIPPPIVLAVRNENTEISQYLISKGATLDTLETGAWAMAFAKVYALDSMVDLLLKEGVEEAQLLQRVLSEKEEMHFGYHGYRPNH